VIFAAEHALNVASPPSGVPVVASRASPPCRQPHFHASMDAPSHVKPSPIKPGSHLQTEVLPPGTSVQVAWSPHSRPPTVQGLPSAASPGCAGGGEGGKGGASKCKGEGGVAGLPIGLLISTHMCLFAVAADWQQGARFLGGLLALSQPPNIRPAKASHPPQPVWSALATCAPVHLSHANEPGVATKSCGPLQAGHALSGDWPVPALPAGHLAHMPGLSVLLPKPLGQTAVGGGRRAGGGRDERVALMGARCVHACEKE
jgi:hypothetical protein